MYICKYCGKTFEKGIQLGGHIINCIENPNKVKRIKPCHKRNKYKLICENCGKEYILELTENVFNKGNYKKTCSIKCAHSLSNKHTNLKQKNEKIKLGVNKYLTNNPPLYKTIIKYCDYCGKQITQDRVTHSKYCSDECKQKGTSQKISKACKGKTGGIRINAYKKYKSGWYNNIHCDSSWELAYVIYCEDHNIPIKRCNITRKYIYNDVEKFYYPDFIINKNEIIEIKGYVKETDIAKQKYNPDIIVLDKEKFLPYLNYVVNTYGNNFIEMYDKQDKIFN